MDDVLSTATSENAGRSKMRRNQYIAALLVSIISLSQGSFIGWATPVLPLLQSLDTPAGFPPIGDEEASWIGSLPSLSSIFSIPFFSYSIDKLGRKYTGYIIAVPFTVCWTLTMCADSVSMLYAARCLGGLSAGGTGMLVSTYATDVAEDDIRGLLGTLYSGSVNLGQLCAYAVGLYVNYTWLNISCLVQPVTFLLAFFWLPESPLFLMIKVKEQEAKRSLAWLRDGRDTEKEFLRLKMRADHFVKSRLNKISLADMMKRSNYRALLICLGLMANLSLTGFAPFTTYAVKIFQDTGSSLSAHMSTLIVAALMAISTVLSSLVVEMSGRRLLLIATDILASANLISLGVYFYLKDAGTNVDSIHWLPITCMSIFILCAGLALVPLPFLMMTELPSPQARGIVQSISSILVSVGVFVTTKTFTSMSHLIGTYGCFWFYGSACAICAVVIYFTVPETKARSSEDIIEQLSSEHYIMSIISHKHTNSIER